ncbi:BrnA antitoxin family protein [Igneacidithiobacillus copahuensis]|uniref:BrnA antitoxin family protein n=1 Tax=Igneacidithiobacillus copahuensis TaxID=2724909 RepID=UPI001C078D28
MKQRRRLEALAQMPDEQIDTSDLPDRTDREWTRPDRIIPQENKQQVTLRLDADVLAFFRGTGKRYQSRINAVLREYMRHHDRAR